MHNTMRTHTKNGVHSAHRTDDRTNRMSGRCCAAKLIDRSIDIFINILESRNGQWRAAEKKAHSAYSDSPCAAHQHTPRGEHEKKNELNK